MVVVPQMYRSISSLKQLTISMNLVVDRPSGLLVEGRCERKVRVVAREIGQHLFTIWSHLRVEERIDVWMTLAI